MFSRFTIQYDTSMIPREINSSVWLLFVLANFKLDTEIEKNTLLLILKVGGAFVPQKPRRQLWVYCWANFAAFCFDLCDCCVFCCCFVHLCCSVYCCCYRNCSRWWCWEDHCCGCCCECFWNFGGCFILVVVVNFVFVNALFE